MPRQTAHPLTPHRVALVSHGRAPDLALFKRLLDFFQVCEQADVRGHLVCARAEAAQRVQDVDVDLSAVGLGGDGVGVREAGELGHALVQGDDLGVLAVEEGEEGGLGAGGALHAPEAEIVPGTGKVPEVPKELLDPERRPLPHRRQLRRLEVGEAEGGEGGVLGSEGGEARDEGGQP